jgi:hypothetical protein
MARLWGGHNKMRKDECVETIRRGLANPAQVRAAVASLSTLETTALALVKQMGGATTSGELAIALYATGIPVPKPRSPYYSDKPEHLIEPLVRRGLFLTGYDYDPGSLYSPIPGRGSLFSDARLLEHVGWPEYHPFNLKPAVAPRASTYRRPQTVVLDAISILQAIDNLGGMPLTKSGTLQINALNKLARALNWQAEISLDGLAFPEPTLAMVNAFQWAGLLVIQNGILTLAEPVERFALRPYTEQIRTWLRGFMRMSEWRELTTPGWYGSYGEHLRQGRTALCIALTCLPVAGAEFYAVDDFDQSLFARIGQHFSLEYVLARPYGYNKTPDQIRAEEAEWQHKLRAAWLKREKKWLEAALTTWLYYLGVVELAVENGTPISFRLTELGQAVLHPESDSRVASAGDSHPAAWIVQPNFDIVVYLDRATPRQLAFLERHAERAQAQQHTAHYRLTREAVYQGLESGTTLETLLTELQQGASVALPPNVVIEIREWAGLRERITLRRRANLLEFANSQAREAGLTERVKGIPIGDRFVLLTDDLKTRDWLSHLVDYAGPLPACLTVTEEGIITLKPTIPDLLIEAQLDRWAERKSGKLATWQLTAASVAAALAAKTSIGNLFKLLQVRLLHPVPALLAVALQNWAGESSAVEIEDVIILRCKAPAVFQALVTSKMLKPCLRGALAPDVLVVETQHLEAVKARLAWAGLKISDTLSVERSHK